MGSFVSSLNPRKIQVLDSGTYTGESSVRQDARVLEVSTWDLLRLASWGSLGQKIDMNSTMPPTLLGKIRIEHELKYNIGAKIHGRCQKKQMFAV